MSQIKTLTKEQAARFPEWVEKWLAVGLSVDRADWIALDEAALGIYKLCKLKRPKVILHMESPFGVTVGGALALGLLKNFQVESQVWSQVRSQVESQVESQVWSGINNYWGGQFWASWYAYISFFHDVCGLNDATLSSYALGENLRTSGWVWWHEDVCAISDRPVQIYRDDRGRLHAADTMAIAYPDTWGVYAWHGVRVPDQVILKPDTLTAEQILVEANAEVRRVMIERHGLDRFLSKANAKQLHTDQDGRRILHRIELPGDEPIVAVQVKCPTTDQTYFLRVPPQIDRCDKAVAWTFGYEKVRDYQPQVET